MGTAGDSHAPYRYNHAKYIVVDSLYFFITSENFKGNGFPVPGKSGNRGWGVCLIDPGVATYFRDVFLTDLNGKGISPTSGKSVTLEPSRNCAIYQGIFTAALRWCEGYPGAFP